MWSIIDEKDFEKFINRYPQLEENQDMFILHQSNGKIFLPRFFYKNFPSKYIQVYNPKCELEKINLEFRGELRENQKPLMTAISKKIQNDGTLNGIIKCPPGFGKAQPLDSKILTPTGWKRMGDISVGDLIIGANGKIETVTGVFPQGIKDVYNVVFNDKSQVECCDEHLWNVRKKPSNKFKTLQLKEIKVNLYRNDNKRLNWFIPMTKPVHFKEQPLKLNPYLMGVLLGDGCLSTRPIKVTTNDQYIVDKCLEECEILNTKLHKITNHDYDYNFSTLGRTNQLSEIMIEYGLRNKKSDNKFIPKEYLWNTVENRIQILQGLMDTDGYVNQKKNEVSFTTTSKQLSLDVEFLVQSLGGKVRTYCRTSNYTHLGKIQKGKPAYYVHITLPKEIIPFQLPRKVKLYKLCKKKEPSRGIKEIHHVGRKECQCISVSSEDGLYITDNFIVTHNTFSAIYIATKLGLKSLFVVDKDSLYKQWIREIVNFTNISAEDIGVIKKNIFHVENKPFVIATVQTLLSKTKREPKEMYEKMKRSGFGLSVFDEVHNTNASEQYSKASIILSSPNIIGLSATPFKFGAQDILMKNVVGNILYSENDYQLIPEINFHFYKSLLDKYRFILSKLGFIESKAFYNKVIINSETYLSLFPKFVKKDMKDGHRTIIICWTEKQVKAISQELTNFGIKHKQFYGKSRDFSRNDKVLVATYQYAGTGFDFKELSSLIYACPLGGKVSLIQTAGRVLRECNGKVNPKIRLLVDMTFPTQFLPECNRAKKIFKEEFKNVKIVDIEEE